MVQPLDEEREDGLARLQRHAVAARTDEPLETIFRAIQRIGAARFVIGALRAGERKEILLRRSDQPGLGRKQLDVVRNIEAFGEETGESLLAILRAEFGEQILPGVDIAGRRGCFHPRIERRNIGRHGSASGAAGAASSAGPRAAAKLSPRADLRFPTTSTPRGAKVSSRSATASTSARASPAPLAVRPSAA